MASLVEKDTSGIYVPRTGETELVDGRTRAFKKFRLPDAPDGRKRFRVGGQIGPIHYRLDPFSDAEEYKEIDLDVVLTPGENWDAACETNGYQVRFWQSREIDGKTVRYIVQYRRAGKWLAMAPLALVWENAAGERELISKPLAVGTPEIDNELHQVTWRDVFGPGLHFRYNLRPDEFLKTLIIENKSDLPLPTIGAAGLRLTIVMGVSWHRSARAANGFAGSVEPEELPTDDELGAADEELDDPATFAYHDELARDVWWLRHPRAWDSAEPTDNDPESGRHEGPLTWRLRRHGSRILAAFSIPAHWLNRPEVVYPVYVDDDIGEEQIGADSDDTMETGAVYPGIGTDYIDLNYSIFGTSVTGYYIGGFRFASVPIPKSATIDSAYLSFLSYFTDSLAVEVKVSAEDVDNAVTWNDETHTPGTDAYPVRTAAEDVWGITVEWVHPDTWYGGEGQPDANDISSVVEEIVNRGGWVSENAIAFIIYKSAAVKADCRRRPYCHDAGPTTVAKFNCAFTEGGEPPTFVPYPYPRGLRGGHSVQTGGLA